MKRHNAITFLAVSLAGCTVGPNYKAPATTMPAKFASTQPFASQPISQWWRTFEDPTLDRLIDDAASANLDLIAAQARVREARAQRRVVAGDEYPTIDASGQVSRSRTSKNSGFSSAGGQIVAPGERTLWQAGFDANWEIDVFGGTRRAVEAADADVEASLADRNDVMLTLLGEVARNYVELRAFQRQAAIAQDNAKSQKETLDITQSKFSAGLTSDLDVARAEAQVATTLAQLPSLEATAARASHRLAVLTGREPGSLNALLGATASIPPPPKELPVGVPSDLLRRRPDIRRAERQLAAATARVGVATADLFPRFTLGGSLGLQSDRFANLASGDSTFWSIGPGVSVPIFNAGKIRANIGVERARTDRLLSQYEQTVLNSLEEVENALVSYQKEFDRRRILATAVESNQRAVRMSQQLYQRGLTTFLDVLETQRALYLTQDELVRSDATVSSNAVSLFKALGGGWEGSESVAAEAPRKRGG